MNKFEHVQEGISVCSANKFEHVGGGGAAGPCLVRGLGLRPDPGTGSGHMRTPPHKHRQTDRHD